ncbi:MAG TPA: ATP-binding protein [Nevskiaceae bacterium]|nr:ATP-binding protein [Nevskiaceae bacterium]
MISVRRRLLAGLIALVIAVDGLAVFLTYQRAEVSTSLLLDYQLQQMALSLRAQGQAAPDTPISPQGEDFAVQVWNKDGTPVYESPKGLRFPEDIPEGYANLQVEDQRWRAFQIETPRRIILVAQLAGIRERLARTIALKTIAPLLLLTPLVAVAIWLIVVRTLEPIKRVVAEVRSRDADTLAPLRTEGLPQEIAPIVAEVNRLLERLSAAFQVQRSFIGDAAHELRSPLTALRLQVQLLEGAKGEREGAETRAKLLAGVERATNLVQQLLTLARNEPGATTTAPVKLKLGDVVREAITECASFSIARGIELAFEPRDEVELVGHAESLRALVRNLVDNAIRYTPRGGHVLVRLASENAAACIEVEDSGPGIQPYERERVFDRFYRGRNTTEDGTGLGLSIVRNVVSRHRGSVALGESKLGGLKVSVTLPG